MAVGYEFPGDIIVDGYTKLSLEAPHKHLYIVALSLRG